jgi:2,4-dienoyl-CoA reductase-like NADH-dependent reductase (Old Yellow Enzyme family)
LTRSLLFEPLPIGSLLLPNRIVATAMVMRLATSDGAVTPALRERYLRLARGGAGLLVLEALSVHGGKSGPLLRLSEELHIPDLRDLVAALHGSGPSKVAAQILHFLKISRSGWRQKIEDLTPEDLRTIVRQYAEAARRAREAGFDAVELHMAHAYTVASSLSRLNRRADGYGGSLENRMRLATEILDAVRREIGGEFPVGVRFDAEEAIPGGYGLEESREIALHLAGRGADYLSVSAGGKFEDAIRPLYPYTGPSGERTMPGADAPDGINLPLSAGIKEWVGATPVVASGKIRTPELAEEVLQTGRADLVGMARALLADPDWPRKAREGRADDIVRCVSMNVCKALDENFRPVRCFLWPKESLHAPEEADHQPPEWPAGEILSVREESGRVRLRWRPAAGANGTEIYRSRNGGPFVHLTSVRGDMKPAFTDPNGAACRYFVRAYGVAGRKSPPSNTVPGPS